MYKWLRPDSLIVQNGVTVAAPLWILSNITAFDDNIPMATCFLLASCCGICWGQTKSGVVSQNILGFCAYMFIGLYAILFGHYLELTACFGGLIMTSRVILDNYQDSLYKIVPLSAPREPGQTSIFERVLIWVSGIPQILVQKLARFLQAGMFKNLGHDLEEISNRPAFAGTAFGASCDMGYLVSGMITHDRTKVLCGLIWIGAYFLTMISCPKDGQDNIFKVCYNKLYFRLNRFRS